MSADMHPFYQRLDQHLGAFTLRTLEQAAHLGDGTLRKGRTRGGAAPNLDIVLAITRVLGKDPVDLLGDDTPPELRGAGHDVALRRIPFLQLLPSVLNPRRAIEPAQLAELADSIAAQGLLQNLVVRQAPHIDMFSIVAGERRFRALEILAKENRMPEELAEHGIPCRVVTGSDAEHTMLALLENMQRVDVNPMDEADALHRLHQLDPIAWSTRAIAERLGVSQRHIQLRLALVDKLTPEAQQQLRTGEIKLAHAKVLVTRSAEEQAEALEEGAGTGSVLDLLDWRGTFPVANAIFDINETMLDVVDSEGGAFFADFEAAMTCQRAAVDVRAAELIAGGCEFADVQEGPGFHDYCDGGSGVVIRLRRRDGRVDVDTGMSRCTEADADNDDDDKPDRDDPWVLPRRYNAEYQAACTDFMTRLRPHITSDEALRLVLWETLLSRDNSLLHLTQYRSEEALAPFAESLGIGDKLTPRSVALAWENLDHVASSVCQGWLGAAVAACLDDPREGEFSPVLDALAARHHVIVPRILRHTAKQRTEQLAKWSIEAMERTGQTDLETAVNAARTEQEAEVA